MYLQVSICVTFKQSASYLKIVLTIAYQICQRNRFQNPLLFYLLSLQHLLILSQAADFMHTMNRTNKVEYYL